MSNSKSYFYSSTTTLNDNGEPVTKKYSSGYGTYTDENGERKYYVLDGNGTPQFTNEAAYKDAQTSQQEVLRSHHFAPLPRANFITFPIPQPPQNLFLPRYQDTDELEKLRRENQRLRQELGWYNNV